MARVAARRDRDRRRGSAWGASGWGRAVPRREPAPSVAGGGRRRRAAVSGTGQGEETALANEAVFERVRTIVAERLGVEEEKVTMEAEFINDLNADSLDLVGVISDLEDAFSLAIADSDMENIRTVGDAVELIAERTS